MVSQGEIRAGADLQPCTVAIIKRLRGMRGDFASPIQFTVAQQGFPQDGALDFQLGLIVSVLIVAAAAFTKIRARRLYTLL